MNESSIVRMFRLMAERVSAGEPWRDVLKDYGFCDVRDLDEAQTARRTNRQKQMSQPSREVSSRLKWLSVGAAAKFVGLETTTIKRLVKDGRLRAVVIPGDAGKWRRIPREDLLTLQREMERGVAIEAREAMRRKRG